MEIRDVPMQGHDVLAFMMMAEFNSTNLGDWRRHLPRSPGIKKWPAR
ncbi:hypothetical protein [Aquabacterium sp.]|nr:hypothetical protein [Aquabacterium sp.]MDI1260422.1 hypothetical protein [Aquabacterium sp.]